MKLFRPENHSTLGELQGVAKQLVREQKAERLEFKRMVMVYKTPENALRALKTIKSPTEDNHTWYVLPATSLRIKVKDNVEVVYPERKFPRCFDTIKQLVEHIFDKTQT